MTNGNAPSTPQTATIVPSPASQVTASPISEMAPVPTDHNQALHVPQASAGIASVSDTASSPAAAVNGPAALKNLTPQQREYLVAQHARMKAAQAQLKQAQEAHEQAQQSSQPQLAASTPPPVQANSSSQLRPTMPLDASFLPQRTPMQVPGAETVAGASTFRPPVRPPAQIDQRRQFLGSFTTHRKSIGLPVPSEMFNGERDGSVKMGVYWVDMLEVFMLFMKFGGVTKVILNHTINQYTMS